MAFINLLKKKNTGLPALILIDMQTMFLNEEKESIIPNQMELMKFYREKGAHLIVIESFGYGSVHHLLENEIGRFDARSLQRFNKHSDDGFSNQQLDKYLRKNSLRHLVLMGVNGCKCVYATAHSAVQNGYSIMTSKDLIHGFCSPFCSRHKYAWYEKNGILQNNYADLLTN